MTYNEEIKNITLSMDEIADLAPVHKSWGSVMRGCRNTPRKSFIEMFEDMGYVVESTIHTHGIGNNNENKIVKRVPMEKGYMADCVIGYFHYTYSIYAKACTYWFEDADKKTVYTSKNLPFRVFSENE